MKRILLSMLLGLMVLGAQAQGKKMLVTYFSWSNNTKALAEEIQRQTGADIYRIEPREAYTTDYNTLAYSIANAEKDANARPVLKDTLRTMQDYDIVFVGCPVWWYDAPMIIHSFLECEDYAGFRGKTIVPFCTFFTATYQTLNDIVAATPEAEHLDGLGLRGAATYSEATVKEWLDRIGISDIVAGIEQIENGKLKNENSVYDLQGRKLESSMFNVQSSMPKKGMYILNGRKYLVK